MIRPMTLACLVLLAIFGFGLFKIQHEVQIMEAELTRLHGNILNDQEAIHALNADWSYLNRPRQLQKLNTKFLGFTPFSAERITTIKELPMRHNPALSKQTTGENKSLEQGLTSPSSHDVRQALLTGDASEKDASPASLAINTGGAP